MSVTKLKTKRTKIEPKEAGVPLRLNLGCGQNPAPLPKEQWGEHWIGVDIAADCNPDYVLDLRETPWPVDDASVDEIFSAHFFEHLSGPERVPFMDECWRVLKVGAKMTIIVPYWSSMRAVQDPFHAWPPVCETSFLYFNKGWREANQLTHYPIKATTDFDFGYGYQFLPDLNARNDEYRIAAARDHINAVMDLHVSLTKRG